MRTFRRLAGESAPLYPGIGLRLVDDFSGARPVPPVTGRLEQLDDSGVWRSSDARATYTPDGAIAFSNLLPATASDGPARRFRVVLDPHPYYDPAYRSRVNGHDLDGLEFVVHPFSIDQAPRESPSSGESDDDYRLLYPSVAYPFPSHVPVVRGVVRDLSSGDAIERAKVAYSNKEQVLTRAMGFALPVRWPPRPTKTVANAPGGTTRLQVERVDGYGTVPSVTIEAGGNTHVVAISNVDFNAREFDISPGVPALDTWNAGTVVRPDSFLIDIFYQTRHATYEVPLPDGFRASHEILLS